MKKGTVGGILGGLIGLGAIIFGGIKVYDSVNGLLPHKEDDMVSIPEAEEDIPVDDEE